MDRLDKVKLELQQFSPEELSAFRHWFAAFGAEAWDRQFAADIEAGKLDAVAERALQGRAAGKCKLHDRRRAEILEALAELYLRLNGYFCIRNYLQHRVEGFGLDTESDLLAIRMPHQEEVLEDGRRQPNDLGLVLPVGRATVDCLIVEVKEPSVEFNEPLRGVKGPQLIVGALRMFGAFPVGAFEPDGIGTRIAKKLHAELT